MKRKKMNKKGFVGIVWALAGLLGAGGYFLNQIRVVETPSVWSMIPMSVYIIGGLFLLLLLRR